MSSLERGNDDRFGAVDAIAGLLAAFSLTASALALVDRPARLAPVAIILSLAAARMSDRFQRLALSAALVAMAAWVVGMSIAVIVEHPLI